MADYTEDQLAMMDDAELERAFAEAKAELDSPETGIEESYQDEEELVDEIEDEIEDEVEDLEQPDEESDDDASTDEEVEDESEEESEEAEVEPDGDDEEVEDDEPAEEEVETTEEVQPVQKRKFKANGREYEFTDAEILEQFPKVFGQAADYTKKTQALSKYRKTIDAIEQAELDHDALNLLIDVWKGDKGAINEIIKRTGVDTLELDPDEHKYTPKDYGRDETTLAINDVIERISHDKEYEVTNRVLGKEWDDRSWNEMTKNPEMIELLHIDIKSGMYDKVQPIADKLKVYGKGTKSDLDYYKEAAGIYFSQMEEEQTRAQQADMLRQKAEQEKAEKAKIAEVKEKQQKAKTVKQESVRKKAAAPTKKAAGTKKNTNYLDESDEAFEEWYKKLEERM